MRFDHLIKSNMDALIEDLKGCIQIPSLYQQDDSGYPYGKPVQDCLEYVLKCAAKLGFSTVNMDNQVGWCEYGEGEEMIAVLGHLDVVPEGDGWTVPPYESVVKDGQIYGRGTLRRPRRCPQNPAQICFPEITKTPDPRIRGFSIIPASVNRPSDGKIM